MFLEILQTLIKVLLLFSILIAAFGLAFYILLSRVSHVKYGFNMFHCISICMSNRWMIFMCCTEMQDEKYYLLRLQYLLLFFFFYARIIFKFICFFPDIWLGPSFIVQHDTDVFVADFCDDAGRNRSARNLHTTIVRHKSREKYTVSDSRVLDARRVYGAHAYSADEFTNRFGRGGYRIRPKKCAA